MQCLKDVCQWRWPAPFSRNLKTWWHLQSLPLHTETTISHLQITHPSGVDIKSFHTPVQIQSEAVCSLPLNILKIVPPRPHLTYPILNLAGVDWSLWMAEKVLIPFFFFNDKNHGILTEVCGHQSYRCHLTRGGSKGLSQQPSSVTRAFLSISWLRLWCKGWWE